MLSIHIKGDVSIAPIRMNPIHLMGLIGPMGQWDVWNSGWD